jgi:chitinase
VSDGQAVILDGTGSSDPDGAIAAYQWRQVNGSPAVALAADSTAVAHFVAPALGSAGALLTFQLTVTDDRGVQNSDTVVVGVNRPPVPDGGSSGSGGGGGGCFITAAGG